ncbi:MAG: TonB-dependent receptor plug domain-containing protein [Caulobacteraceae bacterium]
MTMPTKLNYAANAALLLLCAGAARAQQTVTPPNEVSAVVVTATLTPTPIDEVGSSITLITADEIDAHQWRTLPDALDTTPGLNIVQTGGPGGQTSVFIRGANSNHTEVIIDGIDVNDPSQNGAYDFGQGLASNIEKIEVLRGPESSLYGADALGGVIDIVTPKGEGPPRVTASLEGGSFDTFNQTVGLSGSQGGFHYALDLSHFRSGDTPVTPPGLLAPGEADIGDRYDNVTSSAKLGYDVTRDLSVGLVLRYVDTDYRSTGENFDVFPVVPDSAQTRQCEQQFFSRAFARFDLFDDRFENVVGAAYANFHTTIQSPDDGFGLPAPVVDKADRLKFDWLGTIALDRKDTLVLGVDDTTDRLIDSPVSATENRVGGFAEIQSRPIEGLALAASARFDADDRYGNYVTWRLAPAYTIAATGTLLKGSVGTGFKSPTLSELFVSYPEFEFFANPDLKPERSFGYDIGFEQPLWGGRARFGATWFENDIRDLIEAGLDPAAGPYAETYLNIGRATTHGVESFVSVKLMNTLGLRGDYTWLIARDDIGMAELLRRPRNKFSVTADWRPIKRLRLAASLVYVGAWLDYNRAGDAEVMASPYATVNVSGEYDVGGGVTLFARVDNMLDRRYQDPVGFDKPGLAAYAGIKLALRP